MRVIAYPADQTGCGTYRIVNPVGAATLAGCDARLGSDGSPGRGLPIEQKIIDGRRYARPQPIDADVIVFQRPLSQVISELIPAIQAAGVAVVVDIDDDLTRIDPRHPQYRSLNPATSPEHNWRWLLKACRLADIVTVTTPALATRYAPHGRVAMLPNCVPRRLLDIPRSSDGHTIGWAGWTITHPGDLRVTHGGVSLALDHNDARFLKVGEQDDAWKDLGLHHPPEATGPLWNLDGYYEALARLDVGIAPLIDTQFNAAKCLQLGMRVFTPSGMRTVGSLTPGDKVWSTKGWAEVQAVEKQVAKTGLRVTTEAGRVLELTPEHRMWANGTWKKAQNFEVGDTLWIAPGGIAETKRYQECNWPADSRVSRTDDRATRFLQATCGPTVRIDEAWGRFIGLFVGDGSVGQQTSAYIHCDGQDADLIDWIIGHLSAAGLTPRTEAVTTWAGEVLRRRSVGTSSANLVRFLYGLGLVEWSGGNVEEGRQRKILRIPEIIWRSPRSVQAAFLAGLFEADGSVNKASVSMTTKDPDLARDVQLMLGSFGIESRVAERWNKSRSDDTKRHRSFLVWTRRAGSDVFAKEIGFLSDRKRLKLAAATAKPHSNAYREPQWEDRISMLESCGITTVDIQVAGHEFVVEGLRSHNSWLKPLEYMAAGTPWVASPIPEYLRLAEHGVGAIAKDRARDWNREITRLLTDQNYWTEQSEFGREQVAARHTFEGSGYLWCEAWHRALRHRRGAAHPPVAA